MTIEMDSKQLNDFANLMSELMILQQETNIYLRGKSIDERDKGVFTDKIKELLKRAQQLAVQIKPKEFSVSADISLPPKISISFTW